VVLVDGAEHQFDLIRAEAFHLAREHQRLYPGTAQGQFTLGA